MTLKSSKNSSPRIELQNISVPLAQCLIGFASAAAILVALEHGYEGSWYKLTTIIHHPASANPAFGYRLLFPIMAAQLQRLVPSFTDHNCFIAVQSLIIAATVYLSGKWTSIFLPKFGQMLGYLLLPLMVCPTIGYWTFYDIAIIGFWTACLLLLYYRRFLIYLLVFAAATLNHENILLIVPCAVAYGWGRMRPWLLGLFTIAQLALWCSVRYLVISLVPAGPLFDNRLWENLTFWRHYSPQHLFFAAAVLIPWWLVASMGWKYAPPLPRYSAIGLPGLFLVTILFGKFDEARQFAAFTPTCLALIACWLTHHTFGSVPSSGSTGEDQSATSPSEAQRKLVLSHK